MSLEAELKKFELSSVFTINFSWLKRYVESDNGMYTPMKNISDDTAKDIVENCNVHIEIPVKGVRPGMGVNIVAPEKGVEVLYDPHKEDWNFVK